MHERGARAPKIASHECLALRRRGFDPSARKRGVDIVGVSRARRRIRVSIARVDAIEHPQRLAEEPHAGVMTLRVARIDQPSTYRVVRSNAA